MLYKCIKPLCRSQVNAATDSMTQRLHEVDEMYKVIFATEMFFLLVAR